jgi:hypothetical protein
MPNVTICGLKQIYLRATGIVYVLKAINATNRLDTHLWWLKKKNIY